MGRALRILALGLGGTLLVLLLIAAAFLVEAHIEIGRVTPPLPEWTALAGELAVAEGPARIAYVETASQSGEGPATLGHVAFLLEWDDGRSFLVDAGMEREQAIAFGRMTELAFGSDPIDVHGSVAEQLGAATRRIRGVAFTHLHNDHTGGLPGLCAALGRPLPLFQTPWQAERGNFTTSFSAPHLDAADCVRRQRLSGGPLYPVPGFPGLLVVAGAGHTPGSTLFFARVRGRTWVLAGDVSNFMANLRENRPKPLVYSLFIVPEARGRLEEVRLWLRGLDVRPDVTVLVSHDLDAIEASGLPAATLHALSSLPRTPRRFP
jgi:glyoxylase-like metal-dependent hydrolase (beta-lactamase superfamily II)